MAVFLAQSARSFSDMHLQPKHIDWFTKCFQASVPNERKFVVSAKSMFREYIEAFNSGISANYARFYAPDAILINGAGDRLEGPAAIVGFYDEFKERAKRRIEVLGLVEGRDTLAAALQSTFEVVGDGLSFAGQVLDTGDGVLLRSIVLYELEGGKFKRIQAQTLDRKIMRV